jgi:hypothetical protein
MKTLKRWRLVASVHLALGAIVALAAACSGDDESGAPPTTTKDASVPDSHVTPGEGGATLDAAEAATVQGKPPGCFAGTPVNSIDFLNACTTAAYVVFDNCARIGYCDGGTLPALVTPTVDAGVDASDASVADAADAADATSIVDADAGD